MSNPVVTHRTITLAEFWAELKAQGVPSEHLAFRCPMCGTIQSAHDLIEAGAGETLDDVERYLAFSCIGRWRDAGRSAAAHGGDPPRRDEMSVASSIPVAHRRCRLPLSFDAVVELHAIGPGFAFGWTTAIAGCGTKGRLPRPDECTFPTDRDAVLAAASGIRDWWFGYAQRYAGEHRTKALAAVHEITAWKAEFDPQWIEPPSTKESEMSATATNGKARRPERVPKMRTVGKAQIKSANDRLTVTVKEMVNSGKYFADFDVVLEDDSLPLRQAKLSPGLHEHFESVEDAICDALSAAGRWFRDHCHETGDHPMNVLWDRLIDVDVADLVAQASGIAKAINDTDGMDHQAPAPELLDIPIKALRQHPDNPDPSEGEIVQTMAWLQEGRQDEPITVRALPKSVGCFEVLAGKRRTLAAQRLGWETLQARVRYDLSDDAAAVRYLFASNAQRHEDHPLRKAQGLHAMIAAGMDPQQAGEVFGIQSRAGVTNVLGLLQLPEPWRSRVVSGEIPETAAYAFKPYIEHKSLMTAFEKAYKEKWRREHFQRKDAIRDTLKRIVEQVTRPIDKRMKCNYGWKLEYEHPRYFELTPEIKAKLDVVELPLGKNGKKVEVALNAKAYDKHQVPLIKKRIEERKAGKKPTKKGAAGKKLSAKEQAAEERRKRAAADKKLAEYVKDEWRPALRRLLASQAVVRLPAAEFWRIGFLLTRLLVELRQSTPLNQVEAVAAGAAETLKDLRYRRDQDRWRCDQLLKRIDQADDPISDVEGVQQEMVRLLLWPRELSLGTDHASSVVGSECPLGMRLPPLSIEAVDWIADFVNVGTQKTTVAAGWSGSGGPNVEARELVEMLLGKMNRPQLDSLAKEIAGGLDAPDGNLKALAWVANAKIKQAQVSRLLELHRTVGGRAVLKLPKLLGGTPAKKTTKRKTSTGRRAKK